MDTIPPEVLIKISGYTGVDDRRRLRRVCKSFARLLIAQLFERVSFWFETDCLERFLQFCGQNHISQHIHHLSCGLQHFSPEMAWTEANYLSAVWRSKHSALVPSPPTYHNVSRGLIRHYGKAFGARYRQNRLKDGYAAYGRYFASQTAGQESGAHARTLAKALEALQRLQSLILVSWVTAPGMKDISDLTIIPPADARGTRVRCLLATVISALAQSPPPLREFAIEGVMAGRFPPSTPITEEEMAEPLPLRTFVIPVLEKPLVIKAFSGLRTLRLKPTWLSSISPLSDAGGLATLYSSAPNLEDLSLDFGDGPGPICATTVGVAGTNHFPRLRRLELCEIEFELPDLVAFLIRHAATLRILHLHTIELRRDIAEGGLWVDALEHMRTNLQLEQVSFDGYLLDRHLWLNLSAAISEYPAARRDSIPFREGKVLAEDFVLGKSDVNPLVKMEKESGLLIADFIA